MPGSKSYERLSWSDRFQQPTARQLRDGLPASAKHVFDAVRKRLADIEGIQESLVWYGDCWRWSIEYRTRLSKEPLAVVIPCPQDLQLAVLLEREFASTLPIKRMKRAVRDGLDLAREPFDTRWGIWSLAGSTMLEDLQDLIELKLTHLRKRAG
jgi:hypothetical protein